MSIFGKKRGTSDEITQLRKRAELAEGLVLIRDDTITRLREEAKLSMSISDTEIDRLNQEISTLAHQQEAYSLLVTDCLAWMSEINLPKKTAGTADKERRRTEAQEKARDLGLVTDVQDQKTQQE